MRWITVCGGGNGAHTLVETLLLRDETTHIRLYLPLEDERRHFASALSSHSSFEVRVAGEVYSVASDRICVTGDPEEAVLSPIIMVVPAFAHGAILSQLAPYLTRESTTAALPARSGLGIPSAGHTWQRRPQWLCPSWFSDALLGLPHQGVRALGDYSWSQEKGGGCLPTE